MKSQAEANYMAQKVKKSAYPWDLHGGRKETIPSKCKIKIAIKI